MPSATTTSAGNSVVQYDAPAPMRVASAKPAATTSGPIVSGQRGPIRAASPPMKRDPAPRISGIGSSAAPAAIGLKPWFSISR